MTRIVIIGGVAAGGSAAARARRTDEQAEITVVEKSGHISFANCGLPYYVGGIIPQRQSLLLNTPEGFGKRFKSRVMVNTEAVSLDRKAGVVAVETPAGPQELPYDRLVLCMGANTVIPPIKGLDEVPWFTMRTVEDVDAIQAHIQDKRPESAIIVGGGYIGVETAESLRHTGLDVTVVEGLPRVLAVFDPEAALTISDAMTAAGIKLKTGAFVNRVQPEGPGVSAELSTGETIRADMLFICTGVRPNTGLALDSGLDAGATGGLAVDERMATADPDVFAAGDAVEKLNLVSQKRVLLPLAGPANREGRTAGCNAAGGSLTFPGVLGTSIIGFGDQAAGQTGLDVKSATEAGFDPAVVWSEGGHHAEYYPGSKGLLVKVVYDKRTGRILGGSACGAAGVDKRIDVLATAVYAGLSVHDLESLELAYAPQFNSAKDLVNLAGYVAGNQQRGHGFGVAPDEFLDLRKKNPDLQLLDVRTTPEVRAVAIDGSIHIEINTVRDNLDKIDRSRPVYIYCAVGYRGYVVARMLRHLGYEAYNIMGGIFSLLRYMKMEG